MAEIRIKGITSIKMGDILGDGGMGTTLEAIGVTYEGTARFETSDPTITEFHSEENDAAEDTTVVAGTTTLTFNIIDWTAATLAKVLGGTAGTKTWAAPATTPSIEKSFEVTTKSGFKLNIPRGKVAAKPVADLSKTALGQIQVTVTALAPSKAGLTSWYTTEP